MKKLNAIPTGRLPLLALSTEALNGVTTLAAILNLLQNTAVTVGTDYRTLYGDPGAPAGAPQIGKQGELNEAVEQHAIARQDLKTTVKTGREFSSAAIGLLKNSLGKQLNSQWRDAGFTLRSLAIPSDPTSALMELRTYYRLHPAKESAEQNITATRADTLLTQLQDRRRAVGEKRAAEGLARQARNDAEKALRKRLTGLRNELTQVLAKDDPRWYEFGFKRPIDGRIPELVTGLELKRGLPGEVRAIWDASTKALNYRVKWRTEVAGSTATEVGLFAERDVTIGGLPTGTSIIVTVTARNASGESAPTELSIVVP